MAERFSILFDDDDEDDKTSNEMGESVGPKVNRKIMASKVHFVAKQPKCR